MGQFLYHKRQRGRRRACRKDLPSSSVHSRILRSRPIVVQGVAAVAVVAGEVEAGVEDIAGIADNPGEVAGTWSLSKSWHVPC